MTICSEGNNSTANIHHNCNDYQKYNIININNIQNSITFNLNFICPLLCDGLRYLR